MRSKGTQTSSELTGGAGDVVGRHVCSHNFEYGALNILVGNALNVAIANLFVPDLQRLATDRVEDGQKARLESVSKHAQRKQGPL
jgi:hypothetical protein